MNLSSYPLPDLYDHTSVLTTIENFPVESPPSLFGLNPNA
jgi:hypothetical protein